MRNLRLSSVKSGGGGCGCLLLLALLSLLSPLTQAKRSACWRYGHSCWGGHGKRSGGGGGSSIETYNNPMVIGSGGSSVVSLQERNSPSVGRGESNLLLPRLSLVSSLLRNNGGGGSGGGGGDLYPKNTNGASDHQQQMMMMNGGKVVLLGGRMMLIRQQPQPQPPLPFSSPILRTFQQQQHKVKREQGEDVMSLFAKGEDEDKSSGGGGESEGDSSAAFSTADSSIFVRDRKSLDSTSGGGEDFSASFEQKIPVVVGKAVLARLASRGSGRDSK